MDAGARQSLEGLFRQTTADRVERLTAALLRLERGGAEAERAEIAREIHTLKGESRLMGYTGLAQVLHAAEDLLHGLPAGPAGVDGLLRVCDAVPGLLDGPPDGGDGARLLGARLRGLLDPSAREARPGAGPGARPAAPGGEEAADRSIRVDVERLDQIAAVAGDLLVDAGRAQGRTGELEELLGRWSRLSDQALLAAARLRDAGAAPAADRIERDVHLLRSDTFRFQRRHADAEEAVRGQAARLVAQVGEARLIPISALLAGLPRAARDQAQELGKEVDCTLRGGELGVDRAILRALRDPLVHLLRNAVDHGLELPGQRQRAGKPRAGRLEVGARLEGGYLAVTVEDDGRGIDLGAVREAALRGGLCNESQLRGMEERALLDLVFLPGFTTRAVPGELSGRGVGLEVVQRQVTGLGGSVVLESRPGAGTRVTLRVPQSLALLQVLLVRVGDEVFGLAAADVERVGRVDPVDVTAVAGLRAVRHRGELVPLATLGPLLGLAGPPRARRPAAAFLLHGRDAAALLVDGLLGEREVAVKAPGAFLQGMRFVSGAATLADGRVAILLSTPDLLRAARTGGAEVSRPQRRLRVLVVDDSAVAREAAAALLRGLGHEVALARGGEEAWSLLQAGGQELLLTDVQMPGCDGIELVRRVKGEPRLARLPVAILSSGASPEERRRGMDAGADAYLVKGDLEAGALASTLERLCGVAQ